MSNTGIRSIYIYIYIGPWEIVLYTPPKNDQSAHMLSVECGTASLSLPIFPFVTGEVLPANS